jgi:hypothetical protein
LKMGTKRVASHCLLALSMASLGLILGQKPHAVVCGYPICPFSDCPESPQLQSFNDIQTDEREPKMQTKGQVQRHLEPRRLQ